MKTLLTLATTLLLAQFHLAAQQTPTATNKPAKTNVQVQTGKKAGEIMNSSKPAAVLETPRATVKLGTNQIYLTGFLTEISKSPKPLKLLDIRSPIDLRKDSENLHLDPQTGKIKGIVLFAIKF